MSFSIYDILRENKSQALNDNEELNLTLEADDDFSIDTSLGDNNGEPNGSPDDMSTNQDTASATQDDIDDLGDDIDTTGGGEGGSDDGSSDTGTDASLTDSEEVAEDDKDLFYSLSKEDQSIKIMQLKRQYSDLYSSCNDIIDRIADIEAEGDVLNVINMTSGAMIEIKHNIADYLVDIFPTKSYIENDTKYNMFLMNINGVVQVFEELVKKVAKDQ